MIPRHAGFSSRGIGKIFLFRSALSLFTWSAVESHCFTLIRHGKLQTFSYIKTVHTANQCHPPAINWQRIQIHRFPYRAISGGRHERWNVCLLYFIFRSINEEYLYIMDKKHPINRVLSVINLNDIVFLFQTFYIQRELLCSTQR